MLEVGKNLEIKSLNLGANKFGVHVISFDVALFLLKNKYIHSLNVAEVNQTASSLIYFMMVLSSDQEISNGTLKSLNISRPNPGCMYYFDSVHFADVIGHMLQHNTTLKALHLQKYNFDCHDIESMMFNAIHNNSLHLLDLGCNNIGDHGINHIAKWLVEKPPLKTLILCRNIITDHGARSLSFAIPFSKLVSLDISYNKITDDGMVYILYTLKKFPMLRRLRIFSNCIGHPAAKSVVTMISQIMSRAHMKDCRCCYCFKCQASHYDETCRNADHPDTCTCCKCKGDESSDWSVDKLIANRLLSPFDLKKNIKYILTRVNSMTKENIVRWINIDENLLEENLKYIGYTIFQDQYEKSIPCTSSWAQLSVSALQKYLQESSSKNLLVISKNDPIFSRNVCKNIDDKSITSSDSCTMY
ncbi:Leucine-rich repeat-containing protein 34 [Habropoda laboriosa]|uniref:Leucine-rich repeat-containing protein 34 n=1 Tax=Habropoda laboriosa TaxID=597456 RepID=A0A0L7R0K9_9HYME|nr:Leucine-rich repeat-containing protein 34 [Habropoda laboriosa]